MKHKTKTTLLIARMVLVALLLILIVGCLKCGDCICQRGAEKRGSCPEDCLNPIPEIKNREIISEGAGAVDGSAKNN